MKKSPKYRKLSPLHAFNLLRQLDRQYHHVIDNPARSAIDAVRDALDEDIRARIVKGSR